MQKIKLLHSSYVTSAGTAVPPSSSILEPGVLAINYAAGKETFFIKNSSGDIVGFSKSILTSHMSSASHITVNERTTWNEKQDAISDLATIRNNASSGYSGYQTVTTHTGNTAIHLPTVTSSDAGKVIQVGNDGTWQLVMPSTVYTGTNAPNNTLGTNGDIYIQTN